MVDLHDDVIKFRDYLRPFVGKTEEELIDLVKMESKSKSRLFMLASYICNNFKGKDYFKALCAHEAIALKTIQLTESGRPKEAMSFTPFKYLEIVSERWESSSIRRYFDNTTFLLFIFKKDKFNRNTLIKIGLWRMPVMDLDGELREIWNKVVELINSGNCIKRIDEKGKVYSNFPREAETKMFHVRPHGSDGADVIPLPVPDKVTGYIAFGKQSFWFNHNYVKQICFKSSDI